MTPQEKQALDRCQFNITNLTQRVDALVEQMNSFRAEALRLLMEMSQAHKPTGETQ